MKFNSIGVTEVPHKAFIEIQTAWEAAVGPPDQHDTRCRSAGRRQHRVQSILDRG
ncbi:MAG: hypothetical protein R2911_21940 [Caldilineaceae bacterium]